MKLHQLIAGVSMFLLLPTMVFAKETKDIYFHIKDAAPVVFSHDIHLEKYNGNCRICHNAIFNLKSRRHFTMADMEKTRSCGACHSGVKAFSVKDEKSCTRCHKGKPQPITFKIKGVPEVTFSHEFHLKKLDGKCRSCHDGRIITGRDKNVTMAQMQKGKTCGACHNGKKAFSVAGSCDRCHKGFKPGNIIFKTEGGEVKFSHDFHLEMYKCTDCHTKRFPFSKDAKHYKMSDMDGGKSCGGCHNGKDAFSTSGECDKCHKM